MANIYLSQIKGKTYLVWFIITKFPVTLCEKWKNVWLMYIFCEEKNTGGYIDIRISLLSNNTKDQKPSIGLAPA